MGAWGKNFSVGICNGAPSTVFQSYFRTSYLLIGPLREKTCLRGFANNTGADQPAHPRSLISTFVIHFSNSTISKRATNEI